MKSFCLALFLLGVAEASGKKSRTSRWKDKFSAFKNRIKESSFVKNISEKVRRISAPAQRRHEYAYQHSAPAYRHSAPPKYRQPVHAHVPANQQQASGHNITPQQQYKAIEDEAINGLKQMTNPYEVNTQQAIFEATQTLLKKQVYETLETIYLSRKHYPKQTYPLNQEIIEMFMMLEEYFYEKDADVLDLNTDPESTDAALGETFKGFAIRYDMKNGIQECLAKNCCKKTHACGEDECYVSRFCVDWYNENSSKTKDDNIVMKCVVYQPGDYKGSIKRRHTFANLEDKHLGNNPGVCRLCSIRFTLIEWMKEGRYPGRYPGLSYPGLENVKDQEMRKKEIESFTERINHKDLEKVVEGADGPISTKRSLWMHDEFFIPI